MVAARALQGVGGALLTPGSLALLQSGFRAEDRARAIGAWSGLGGVATAIGPFAGGWLVSAASWRWIFLLNVPLAAMTLVATRRVPESRDTTMAPGLDIAGSVAAAVGLAGVTWALIGADSGAAGVPAAAVIGVGSLLAFIAIEARSPHPLMPLELFANRWFAATNVVTLALYFALGRVLLPPGGLPPDHARLLARGGGRRPLPADRGHVPALGPGRRRWASASGPASR